MREAICAATIRSCVDAFENRLRGIVLSGSLARGEATLRRDSGLCAILGDAEFFLVFQEKSRLPKGAEVDGVRQQIESMLKIQNLGCPIDLSPVHPSYLRGLDPHILAYELKECGQVVWGDSGLLSLIPRFPVSDIYLEDAWRLLCNRMIEYLAVAPDLPDSGPLPQAALYRTVKLYLDMATSLLLFAGRYEPTYRARAERLLELADSQLHGSLTLPAQFRGREPADDETRSSAPRLPAQFDREFAERVDFCTRFKLGNCDSDGCTADFSKDAVRYAHALWRWELAQLTQSKAELSDRELMRRWMRRQPMIRRLRGWVRVFRDTGWRSYRDWPRWCLLACTASPRHWIYAAGAEIFIRAGGEEELQAFDSNAACRGVPLPPSEGTWKAALGAVLANYGRFVAVTRS